MDQAELLLLWGEAGGGGGGRGGGRGRESSVLCAGEGLCVKTERARIFRENQVQIQRLPMSLACVLGLFGEAWWDPPEVALGGRTHVRH